MDLKLFFLRIRNWADLDELGPVVLPLAVHEACQLVERAVATLPDWRVESADPAQGTMHLTRTTRVFRFVDDINLKLTAEGGGTRLRGRSQSRMGLSDLGQNGRNLRELVAACRSQPAGEPAA